MTGYPLRGVLFSSHWRRRCADAETASQVRLHILWIEEIEHISLLSIKVRRYITSFTELAARCVRRRSDPPPFVAWEIDDTEHQRDEEEESARQRGLRRGTDIRRAQDAVAREWA